MAQRTRVAIMIVSSVDADRDLRHVGGERGQAAAARAAKQRGGLQRVVHRDRDDAECPDRSARALMMMGNGKAHNSTWRRRSWPGSRRRGPGVSAVAQPEEARAAHPGPRRSRQLTPRR
jgi:hypothetical protein